MHGGLIYRNFACNQFLLCDYIAIFMQKKKDMKINKLCIDHVKKTPLYAKIQYL